MISKNFYYRVYYQFNNCASRKVFYKYLIDRFFHPFNSHKKKQAANRHKRYLKTKKNYILRSQILSLTGQHADENKFIPVAVYLCCTDSSCDLQT